MKLSRAANYFARTPIDGWNGSAWISDVARGALQPHDRFVSDREFGLKKRYVLVNPETPVPSQYTALRIAGESYALGRVIKDVQVDPYSLVCLVISAPYQVQVITLTPTIYASGVAGAVTETVSGTYWADIGRLTFTSSREAPGVRFSEVVITLPANCSLTGENEIKVGGAQYNVEEVYNDSGFVCCRATTKRVP